MGNADRLDLRRIGRPTLDRRALRYGAAPRLQRALLSLDIGDYDRLAQELMQGERYRHLRWRFEREQKLVPWNKYCEQPKLHEHRPQTPHTARLLQASRDHKKWEAKRELERDRELNAQSTRHQMIRTRFQEQRAQNQILSIIARQSSRWDLDERQLRRNLTRWASKRRLTNLHSLGRAIWNDLWHMAKDRLSYSVEPGRNRDAILAIDAHTEDDFVEAVFECVTRRVVKDQIREHDAIQLRHESTTPDRSQKVQRLSSSMSHSSLSRLSEPILIRNHPERIGYDFSDYNGLLFEPELLLHGKEQFPIKPQVDVDGSIRWYREQERLRQDLETRRGRQDHRRMNPSVSAPKLSVEGVWRKELHDFEQRLESIDSSPFPIYVQRAAKETIRTRCAQKSAH